MPWYKEVEGDVRHHKKEIVMVAGTLVLVVFAYLTWRRSQGGSSVPQNATSGVSDAAEGFDQSAASIANAVKSQTGVLDQLNKRLKNLNTKTKHLNAKELRLNKKAHRQIVQNRHTNHHLNQLLAQGGTPRHKVTHPSKKTGTHHHPKRQGHAGVPNR